jgi:hypothetical protein
VADPHDHRLEPVGESVQWRDRIADVGLAVAVLPRDVVADRVDDDEPDLADSAAGVREFLDVARELEPVAEDCDLGRVAAGRDDARLDVDRR